MSFRDIITRNVILWILFMKLLNYVIPAQKIDWRILRLYRKLSYHRFNTIYVRKYFEQNRCNFFCFLHMIYFMHSNEGADIAFQVITAQSCLQRFLFTLLCTSLYRILLLWVLWAEYLCRSTVLPHKGPVTRETGSVSNDCSLFQIRENI